MKAFDTQTRERIVSEYRSGLSSSQIVKQTGISERTVLRIIRDSGLPVRGKRTLSPDLYQSVVDDYKAGMSAYDIERKYKVGGRKINKVLKQYGISIRNPSEARQEYEVNESYFDKIDTHEKAYYLGFLWADGHNDIKNNNVMLRLAAKDLCVLEKFKRWIGSTHPIRTFKNREHDAIAFNMKNQHLSQTLLGHGMVQDKTTYPTWPKIPDSLVSHFIRGYFDGDGCWYINENKPSHGKISFSSVPKMLKFIQEDIKKHTGMNFHLEPHGDSLAWVLTKGGTHQMFKFGKWMYQSAGDAFLPRKHQKFLKTQEYLEGPCSRSPREAQLK